MRTLALRAAAIVLCLAAIGLAVTSISRVKPLAVTLTTLDDEPIHDAILAYRYKGYRFNFVDSLTYYRPGEALRLDGAGRFEIPGFIEFHPPLDTGLSPWIEWVYVPELHHFFGPIGPRSENRPGLVKIDWERGVFEFADLSEDPERWSQTIRELRGVVQISHAIPVGDHARYKMTDAIRASLNTHLREEFSAFVEQHANTPRAMPDPIHFQYMADEERRSRLREIQKNLDREPHWGPMIERLWPELATP